MLIGRALLLDMDGTLVDSHAAVERCWRHWATQHELDPEVVLKDIHGKQGQVVMAELLPDRPMAENIADNQELLAAETADVDGVAEIPGALALMKAIGSFPHALVTSADHALATARMHAAGIAMPAVRVLADDVRASKPHPEGFLSAATQLGVPPEECIVFEDSEAGIQAARAAGMRVVGVGRRAAELAPDLHVADLTELRMHIAGNTIRLTSEVEDQA
ncbi:HAD-IA family hydrolase [Antrihabitans sp. YC2-6]|uniref:HAD-IA family hydrolase n=1 Tax=Antrihabitans sp. YC2-6 TaxID=2799498 RepID=UPI0018F49BB1|nr:HAD-IA family hydrolase [Antrihabitans sp. YC2-6]MBJ8345495.1 HAD-IA family hydrolase [Antrihabitans sp. YC2-6]